MARVSGKPLGKDPANGKAWHELTLGERVRSLRLRAGLTQEALGKLAGCQQECINRVELGKNSLTVGKLQRIAVALGVYTGAILD